MVDVSLESPCRVLVKCNWTSFSISYGLGTTRQNVSRLAAIRRGRSVRAKISGGGVVPGEYFLVSTKLDTFCYLIVQAVPCACDPSCKSCLLIDIRMQYTGTGRMSVPQLLTVRTGTGCEYFIHCVFAVSAQWYSCIT